MNSRRNTAQSHILKIDGTVVRLIFAHKGNAEGITTV